MVLNLLLLQEAPGFTSINPVAWSLSLEMYAYLAFPLLAVLLVRVRRVGVAFGLAGATLAIGMWLLHTRASDDFHYWSVELVWTRIAIEFPTGCLLALGWRRLNGLRFGRHWDVATVLAAAGIAVVVTVTPPTHIIHLPVLALPLLALLVLALAGASGPVGRLMSVGPLVWAGRASFALYMVHFLVLHVLALLVLRPELKLLPLPVRLLLLAGFLALPVAVAAADHPGSRSRSGSPSRTASPTVARTWVTSATSSACGSSGTCQRG